jgi:hypothetical protein
MDFVTQFEPPGARLATVAVPYRFAGDVLRQMDTLRLSAEYRPDDPERGS